MRARLDRNMRRRGFNEATISARRRTRIQSARDVHRARCHATQQSDGALMVLHRPRFNHPGIIDYAREQGVFCASTHDDLAAVRPDHPTVFGQAIQ